MARRCSFVVVVVNRDSMPDYAGTGPVVDEVNDSALVSSALILFGSNFLISDN